MANETPRVLIVEGNQPAGEAAAARITAYFQKRSIPITCDWVNSVERSLVQVRYYEYDAAVVAMHPQPDESGIDFLDLMEQRHFSFPVLLIASPDNGVAIEDAKRRGAAIIMRGANYLDTVSETVDHAILTFRARREQETLAGDVREKNKELRAMNEILARQSVRFLKLKKEQESQRRRMESLLNAMSDGVVFVNSRREIEMLNPAARAIFRTEGADKGFSLDDLKAFTGIDPFDMATEEETPAAIFSIDYHVAVRIVEEDGAQMGRMVVLRNVTQEKEVERLKAEFQSMVSHELRTPLTAISGYVETLADGAVDEPETARHMLGIIQRQTGRLGRLIDDLLALSNIELEKGKFEFLPLPAEPLIKGAAQMFAQAAANQGVTLDWIVEDGAMPFEADKDRLMQVFINLLDNAIKYTPAGGAVVTRCRMLSVDRHTAATFDYPSLDGNPLLPETDEDWSRHFVEWFITDTGEGIPAHAIPRLMERFYRVDRDRSRERGGTGLGLSIVKHIIIAHRGSIKVESEPGKGTTVRFVIPLARKIP